MNPNARLVGGSFQAFCSLCLFTLSPPKTEVSVWFIDGVLAAESVIICYYGRYAGEGASCNATDVAASPLTWLGWWVPGIRIGL